MEKQTLFILVIDPERDDHQLIRDSLERSGVPAEIFFVTTTDDGLKKIAHHKLDLVITDHSLPQANAFQLLFEIQQRRLSLPVIILTREEEARLAREAFQRGVDDYLWKEELGMISLFDVIGNIIEKKRRKEEESQQETVLKEQAEKDGLTGLYNHRFFIESLEREFARARRYHRDLSLLMIDLDGFKEVNDRCGHPQGDELICYVSQLLKKLVRFVDIVARYGGDEFAILLPETDLPKSFHLAKRIVRKIREEMKKRQSPSGLTLTVSASIGLSGFRSSQRSSAILLKEADQALYEAKKLGRNRVEVYEKQRG